MVPIPSGVSDHRKPNKDEVSDGHNCGATLVGLRADPASSPEDWENDFDFDSSTSILPPAAARGVGIDPPPAAGQSPSPRASITLAERRDLEELLKTMPTYSICPENIGANLLSQNLPAITKLGIKDLLREMQHTSFTPSDPLSEIHSQHKDRANPPKAGLVESQELNLALAKGKKNLQVIDRPELFNFRLFGSDHINKYRFPKGEVFAHVELARTYRSTGQTGSAMLQLQHALKALGEW
jgi:hypothetical protein